MSKPSVVRGPLWDETLQLFGPVEDYSELRGRRASTASDHHEPLSVQAHIVVGEAVGRLERELSFEQTFWGSGAKLGASTLPWTATTIMASPFRKKISLLSGPQRLDAASRRDLPAVSTLRKSLNVDLEFSRLVGDISEPSAIG